MIGWNSFVNCELSVPSPLSASAVALHLLETEAAEREHRCRALSSDEDSSCQDGKQKAAEGPCSARRRPREPLVFSNEPSSGYSSVQSTSPSSSTTSTLMPCTFTAVPPDPASHSASAHAVPGFRLLVPMQRPRCAARRQVKRKNAAAHSGGEMEEEDDEDVEVYAASVGFLSL